MGTVFFSSSSMKFKDADDIDEEETEKLAVVDDELLPSLADAKNIIIMRKSLIKLSKKIGMKNNKKSTDGDVGK